MHPNSSSRRVHSAEFKARILTECRQPGASVSAVAIAHGLNTNVVRKWLAGRGLKRMGDAAVVSLGKERIAPLCSPSLKDRKKPWKALIVELTLIDSQLSQVTWRDWFTLNGLEMPQRARQSFDRAALSVSAAVDGMGVALESTRFAEKELARGDLIEVGPTVFKRLERETHFFSLRSNEKQIDKIKSFKNWLLNEVQLSAKAK